MYTTMWLYTGLSSLLFQVVIENLVSRPNQVLTKNFDSHAWLNPNHIASLNVATNCFFKCCKKITLILIEVQATRVATKLQLQHDGEDEPLLGGDNQTCTNIQVKF